MGELKWRSWLEMMNKKGFGGAIAMFFAILAIALIFGLFFIGGKMATTFTENEGGIVVLDEKGVELDNLFKYMDRYVELSEERFVSAGNFGGSG